MTMKEIIREIRQGWHFARWVRLILSVIILVQYFIVGDGLLLLLGLLLGTQALFNAGCCRPVTGLTSAKTPGKGKAEIIYEEVK